MLRQVLGSDSMPNELLQDFEPPMPINVVQSVALGKGEDFYNLIRGSLSKNARVIFPFLTILGGSRPFNGRYTRLRCQKAIKERIGTVIVAVQQGIIKAPFLRIKGSSAIIVNLV